MLFFEQSHVVSYSSKDRNPKQNSALYVYPDIQQGQVVSGDTKFDLSKKQRQGRLSYVEWKQGRRLDSHSTTQEMLKKSLVDSLTMLNSE